MTLILSLFRLLVVFFATNVYSYRQIRNHHNVGSKGEMHNIERPYVPLRKVENNGHRMNYLKALIQSDTKLNKVDVPDQTVAVIPVNSLGTVKIDDPFLDLVEDSSSISISETKPDVALTESWTGDSKSFLLLNVVAVIWGTQHVVIKSALDSEAFHPSVLNAWRFAFSAALFLPQLIITLVCI